MTYRNKELTQSTLKYTSKEAPRSGVILRGHSADKYAHRNKTRLASTGLIEIVVLVSETVFRRVSSR
ncbi:hypothetical protein [Paenibacillus xylanilyticus]|uniref:hypothetical protein n=1 Tax=Paenibacillus xylanilyticus TaxID=248903 RepID=UPI0039A2F141